MTLRAPDLIASACAASGLPARGESWREGLDLFVSDLASSTTANATGIEAARAMAVETLAARFAIEDYHVRHPDLASTPVPRPVFILGLPRAGTTLLLNLLALDPRHRTYGNFEANREIPPLDIRHRHDDPRIARKVAEVDQALELGALDHRYHVELGDEPGECVWLMGQDFKGYPWLIVTPAPRYREWLLHGGADMRAAFAHHRRALQAMQVHFPGQWILKHPLHAVFLDDLLAVYPDARIVVTHRDPLRPLASSCSASRHLTDQFNDDLDPADVGTETLEILRLTLEGVSTLEQRHPDLPVHHLHYRDLVADPMAQVVALYRFMGETLSDDVLSAMAALLDRKAALRSQAGGHAYSLSQFGLDPDALPPVFDSYVQQFAIARERVPA